MEQEADHGNQKQKEHRQYDRIFDGRKPDQINRYYAKT